MWVCFDVNALLPPNSEEMWKESSRRYQSVFTQSLCLYAGMLADKSSPKEVWNQRRIRCWGSAWLLRKLRNISSLCSLVAFQVWRLSTRCRHSCQEHQGVCYITRSASTQPKLQPVAVTHGVTDAWTRGCPDGAALLGCSTKSLSSFLKPPDVMNALAGRLKH